MMPADGRGPTPIAANPLERTASDADRAITHTRVSAQRLSRVLGRAAEAFEKSAALAEQHAQRRAKAGRSSEADDERRAAEWARQAAERARLRAAEASGWAVR